MMPADAAETCEVKVELYVKDRNPNFRPELELWPFGSTANSLQDSPGDGIGPPGDAQGKSGECLGADPAIGQRCRYRVKRVASTPEGAIHIGWECESGIELVIEAADSPTGPWTTLSDRLQSVVGPGYWVDSTARNGKCRFYRMRQVF